MQYELAYELVSRLETFKRYHLYDSQVLNIIAKFVSKYDVKDLVLLNEVAESLLSVNFDKPETPKLGEISPYSLMESELMAKEIAPLVSDIRKKLFGSEDIPFSSRELALEWMDKYALGIAELFGEYMRAIDSSMGGEATLRFAQMESKTFRPDSPPGILYEETKEISNDLGIEGPSLVWHLLTNAKLVVGNFWATSSLFYRGYLLASMHM